MAALTLALDLCFNKSATEAEDRVRRAELKEACWMLQESKSEMPAADRFLAPLMELLRKHKIQLQDAGVHNQYLTPPESTTTPNVQKTCIGSSYHGQSMTAQAPNVSERNISVAANPDLDFDGLWQEFINMVPDSSAPGWDDLLADFDQASLFIEQDYPTAICIPLRYSMRAIQVLPDYADLSDKWPSHVWSKKAVSRCIDSKELITLVSSQDKSEVYVNKDLLCFFSSYYAAALNGKFLEANKDRFEVDLSGEHLVAFRDWMYMGTFDHLIGYLSEGLECLYVKLYLFADQTDIIALRRNAISHLADEDLLTWDLAKLILMNLPENSPLRRYALDSFIAHWEPSYGLTIPRLDSQSDPEYLLSNFLGEVLTGVALRKLPTDDCTQCPCDNDLCRYHEHESEEEREATCGKIQDAKLCRYALDG
ncbi:hypothetical protein KCU98_g7904, partial [Aureobasidium melanogenum]